MPRKKTAAQLDTDIRVALAKPANARCPTRSHATKKLDARDAAQIEQAADAVFARRGSEELTKEEWCEEVRGLLSGQLAGSRTEKLINKLYEYFHGAMSRPFRSQAVAPPPDTYEVEIESSRGQGFRTLASYATYDDAKRHARAEIDNDRYAVRVRRTEYLGSDEVKTRLYTFRDDDYVDEHPERL